MFQCPIPSPLESGRKFVFSHVLPTSLSPLNQSLVVGKLLQYLHQSTGFENDQSKLRQSHIDNGVAGQDINFHGSDLIRWGIVGRNSVEYVCHNQAKSDEKSETTSDLILINHETDPTNDDENH